MKISLTIKKIQNIMNMIEDKIVSFIYVKIY